MFADVNICKSRCWARADWGPPEGLEEALFTCSEECCPAWTLLYLSGTWGSQRWERWAALSLSKVSTSQYQQQSTMWATWEEEMEFLLVLLRRSQTRSRCPLVPLIVWAEQKNRGETHRGNVVHFGGALFALLLLNHSWEFLCLLKISQSPCSGSISSLFSMQWFSSIFTVLPLNLHYLHLTTWCRALTIESMTESAPVKPFHHTFNARRSPPRAHWRGGGYCSNLFKADKCFTRSFYLDNGFIIIFPVGADCQSQRRIQGQQTHFVSKLSAGSGVVCRAQTSLNLTRVLNISQARKRQLKAPYYYFSLFFHCKQDESFGRAHPIIM